MSQNISRRKFLKDGTCAAMGTTAFLSSVLNLGAINTLAARPHIISNTNDHKALVCILLAGGIDTYNVLVPNTTNEYDSYVTARGDLALPTSSLLPLENEDQSTPFAVHNRLPQVKELYESGELAFLANIGTLAEPLANKTEYDSSLTKKPLGLYSHSDQQMQWQTSLPLDRNGLGFAGRLADLMHDMNTIPQVSMNISLSGKNNFQRGENTSEYSISENTNINNIGYTNLSGGWGANGYVSDLRTSNFNNMAEQTYSNIFHQTIGALNKSTSESIEYYRAAFSNLTPITTSFNDDRISRQMKKIAELISIQQYLGLNRQVFFVVLGGWDHHNNLFANQFDRLPQLNDALFSFRNALQEIGKYDDVVTFTISDFARTLTRNNSYGSDHAWGGHQMIMGGPIAGRNVYGNYPEVSLTNPLNVSPRGNLIPTLSVDELYAELALWFGASNNDLDYLLPNLCNFYDSAGCTNPPAPNYAPIGLFS